MLENVYKVDGKYPDPYQIRQELDRLEDEPGPKITYKRALSELSDSGLSRHPLLSRHSVES
jgi:hypothetical protein